MRLLYYLLFCLFFAVGAGAIAVSFEDDRIFNYYKSKDLVQKAQAVNRKIEELNADYDAQLQYVRSNPNVLHRLEEATLGRQPTSLDTAFPKASEKQLAIAAKALFEDIESQASEVPAVGELVERCTRPALRNSLFFAGAALILIAFIFFGSTPPVEKNQT